MVTIGAFILGAWIGITMMCLMFISKEADGD
jgi:hypothetical protein